MSKFLKQPIYNGRSAENHWVSLVFSTHDSICSCDNVVDHFNYIINQQKCHRSTEEITTTETTGTIEKEEMPFDAKDLEALFAENQEDDDG